MPKQIHIIDAPAPPPPKLKRVAAYARVSMESERLTHSFSAQVSHYSKLIQRTPGWQYAGVYADEGITGTRMDIRPEFQRMIADCEAGRIDIILTKSISRFARNTVDTLNTVRRLKELGIEVRFEREGISSLSGDGELTLTLLASFAQEESRSISENCKWSIRKGYQSGMTKKCTMYGYRLVDGELTIIENEAEVVRRIFQMYLDGDSCYAIARKLNAEGIPSRRGTKFCANTIQYMIRQEKYSGCTLAQKYVTESHLTKKEVPNHGLLPMYLIEDTHPAIISRETFLAAQEEFARRYGVGLTGGIAENAAYLHAKGPRPPHRPSRWTEESHRALSEHLSSRENKNNAYPFSRFMKCEVCGCNLVAKAHHYADGSVETYWQCVNHSRMMSGGMSSDEGGDVSSEMGSNAPDDAPSGVPTDTLSDTLTDVLSNARSDVPSNKSTDIRRPVCLHDTALRQQVAEAMGMETFNPDEMHTQLSYISVLDDMVTLHYKDGRITSFQYIKPKWDAHKRRKRKRTQPEPQATSPTSPTSTTDPTPDLTTDPTPDSLHRKEDTDDADR